MRWEPGEVTILLPGGDGLKARGFIHGEVAIAENEGEWLVLHRRSGLELGRFAKQATALDLGERLTRYVSQSLKRLPQAWAEGLWQRLEEIRAETARENGMPPPSPLHRQH